MRWTHNALCMYVEYRLMWMHRSGHVVMILVYSQCLLYPYPALIVRQMRAKKIDRQGDILLNHTSKP